MSPSKRLLTRAEAAAYCGVSAGAFDSICPVRPIALGSDRRLERYDIQSLDQWIDRLSLPASASTTKEQALAELGNGNGSRRRHSTVP
jgi:hypothetical protein